jgi:glycosyltransferase involved in cell wall biosynthesis
MWACRRYGAVEVISNAVNREIFHPILDEASLLSWKKRLSLGKEDIVVTFIGNLAPWQGVNDLIQVAPALLGRKKNIRFLVIGDGVLKEDLEEEVRRLGISQHFLFTGMVNYDQIPFYINITDICVTLKRRLKSGYSPLKLYEYMACGKPVVASRVEGLEFIEAEGAGRLVEPGDLRSLERVLLELIVGPQKRVEMGQKGLQIVKNRFSWDLGALMIEKILEKLA